MIALTPDAQYHNQLQQNDIVISSKSMFFHSQTEKKDRSQFDISLKNKKPLSASKALCPQTH